MTNYNQEIIDYLISTEENFEGLIIAKNKFDDVKTFLINEFWNKVVLELESKYKNTNWIVKRSQKTGNQKNDRITILDNAKNKIAPDKISICWERLSNSYPFYGVWVNNGDHYDYAYQYFKEFQSKIDYMENPDSNWPLWGKYDELDFDNDTKLVRLLPMYRDEYVNDCSDLIYNFHNAITSPNNSGHLSIYDNFKKNLSK